MTVSREYPPPIETMDVESTNKVNANQPDEPVEREEVKEEFFTQLAKDNPGKMGLDGRYFEPADPDPLD